MSRWDRLPGDITTYIQQLKLQSPPYSTQIGWWENVNPEFGSRVGYLPRIRMGMAADEIRYREERSARSRARYTAVAAGFTTHLLLNRLLSTPHPTKGETFAHPDTPKAQRIAPPPPPDNLPPPPTKDEL